jgi:hypothetical protein
MRPRTIGPKPLIIAATALAITIAGSAEAEHDHGGEGWDGGDRHEGRGWHGGEDRHEGWGRHGGEDRHEGWGWHGGEDRHEGWGRMAGKIGTRVGVGMAAVAGMALQAGTTTADISVGTSTDGAVPGGADPSPWPTAGAGPGLSAPVRAGGIGATRGGGAALAGDGAPVHGLGVACWLVPRSA